MKLIIDPQPRWADGDEPDRIENIKGGFIDGVDAPHPLPKAFKKADAVKEAGVWYWQNHGSTYESKTNLRA